MKLTKFQEFWAKHIKDCEASGLTQAEYCRRHRLKKGTFSAQKSTLKQQGLLDGNIVIPLKKQIGGHFSMKVNGLELSFVELPDTHWMASLLENLRGSNVESESI